MVSSYVTSFIPFRSMNIEVMAQCLVLSLFFIRCILGKFIPDILENQYPVLRMCLNFIQAK